jgi:lipopolysaccharide export system protein LptA
VVSPAPAQNGNPQPDRVSTSDRIVANFGPKGGMSGVVQEGNFTFTSGTLRAFAQSARYQPEREHVVIEGSPRMEDVGTLTTADTFILNRSSGQLLAQGHVKTSYSDVKAQPAGALLAASDPIHVTANQMTASNDPGIATYTGNARLWQNANVIEAPSIQFQKEQRTVVANSKGDQKVSTILVGTDQRARRPWSRSYRVTLSIVILNERRILMAG